MEFLSLLKIVLSISALVIAVWHSLKLKKLKSSEDPDEIERINDQLGFTDVQDDRIRTLIRQDRKESGRSRYERFCSYSLAITQESVDLLKEYNLNTDDTEAVAGTIAAFNEMKIPLDISLMVDFQRSGVGVEKLRDIVCFSIAESTDIDIARHYLNEGDKQYSHVYKVWLGILGCETEEYDQSRKYFEHIDSSPLMQYLLALTYTQESEPNINSYQLNRIFEIVNSNYDVMNLIFPKVIMPFPIHDQENFLKIKLSSHQKSILSTLQKLMQNEINSIDKKESLDEITTTCLTNLLFFTARSALIVDNLEEAKRLYERYLQKYPDKIPVYFELATVLERSGDIQGADEALKKTRELSDTFKSSVNDSIAEVLITAGIEVENSDLDKRVKSTDDTFDLLNLCVNFTGSMIPMRWDIIWPLLCDAQECGLTGAKIVLLLQSAIFDESLEGETIPEITDPEYKHMIHLVKSLCAISNKEFSTATTEINRYMEYPNTPLGSFIRSVIEIKKVKSAITLSAVEKGYTQLDSDHITFIHFVMTEIDCELMLGSCSPSNEESEILAYLIEKLSQLSLTLRADIFLAHHCSAKLYHITQELSKSLNKYTLFCEDNDNAQFYLYELYLLHTRMGNSEKADEYYQMVLKGNDPIEELQELYGVTA